MNHTILMLLKFGQQEHIYDLYENGTVYMNTVEHFRRTEDSELRGDKFEGATKVINSLPGTFKIPGINREFKYQKIHLKEAYEIALGNIFSLYSISSHGFPNPLEFKIDERNQKFGTHCLIIENISYFLNRLEECLTSQGFKFWHGFVEYFDKDSISKELTPFDKPLEFEYQKEFRFFIQNNQPEPMSFKIGSLKNHAEVVTSEQAMEIQLVPQKRQ